MFEKRPFMALKQRRESLLVGLYRGKGCDPDLAIQTPCTKRPANSGSPDHEQAASLVRNVPRILDRAAQFRHLDSTRGFGLHKMSREFWIDSDSCTKCPANSGSVYPTPRERARDFESKNSKSRACVIFLKKIF